MDLTSYVAIKPSMEYAEVCISMRLGNARYSSGMCGRGPFLPRLVDRPRGWVRVSDAPGRVTGLPGAG
jgi:hypothetical protein